MVCNYGALDVLSVQRAKKFAVFRPSEEWDNHIARRNPGLWRRRCPKQLSQPVYRDLDRVSRALVLEEPRIEEIWLFGSYARGTFDLGESDIDLGVFVNAQGYFYEQRVRTVPDEEEGVRSFHYMEPSSAVSNLQLSLESNSNFPEIYDLFVVANGELPFTQSSKGIDKDTFLRNIRRGKLFYSSLG